MRDFRLAGVALELAARERFAAISVELSSLSNAFSSALLDATDHWFEHITDEALLAGVAEPDKAMFAEAARQRDLDGWVVMLQAPSTSAIMNFAENRQLRFRVYEASTTRASDQGSDAGKFDNSERIARILELRHEAATLLGYKDPVERSLATKMAPSADAILSFLRDLAARAKPAAGREFAELQRFAAADLVQRGG
ncbi:M3 family metallopeptidase [Sphingomonas jeddahensis]|uniref:Oligopeptidase A n=1 Tax=Sphingomonas jeddahensis TaxID=1915074 RepID=A0A1V2ESQ6_9SPHN|nr:M3 family metallopeptidase [Sphingomonas jeddahensis]ONF95318.1 Oligopeptidase A [Sphingomonas jeddahensis]